jgi:hypothetical protein
MMNNFMSEIMNDLFGNSRVLLRICGGEWFFNGQSIVNYNRKLEYDYVFVMKRAGFDTFEYKVYSQFMQEISLERFDVGSRIDTKTVDDMISSMFSSLSV